MRGAMDFSERLSRRGFLKAGGLGLLGLAVPLAWTRLRLALPGGQMGRVAGGKAEVFLEPSFDSRRLHTYWRDDVLAIDAAVIGGAVPEHNRVWYHFTDVGYVHSSPIQPVRTEPNAPVDNLPQGGQLMEVSVPFVDAFWRVNDDAERAYRFYYGTTHWIDGKSRDARGRTWYRIRDDKWTFYYYAQAEAFRPIPAEELAPISPDVPASEKRILVNLTEQWVQCYEGTQMVFSTKISGGDSLEDGTYATPVGEFTTSRKRPSRHMAAGNLATGYDLPGVPWVSYITEEGISFHGTYWHNDFGTPRSHGCLNMSPMAARWLYRWTTPVVPPPAEEVWVGRGTFVRIMK